VEVKGAIIPGFSFGLRLLSAFIFFQFPLGSFAQICIGSLGDPVVNVSFDSAGRSNYVPANSYSYSASTCPDSGFYSLTKATTGCFNNSWITINSDHTGNGNFMLVNASGNPWDFFETTVTNLCPNTNYQFAAWLLNVFDVNGYIPDVTFRAETLDGTLISEYTTGDIHADSPHVWTQYGFFFTTPATNPVIVLRMWDNAPGGIGNVFAVDDITLRPCGPHVTASINGSADTVNVCEGNTNVYSFTASVSTDFADPVYQWQASTDSGKTWQDITGANTLSLVRQPSYMGSYLYRLSVVERTVASISGCRVSSNPVAINVHSNPMVSAGPDKTELAGTPVQLQGSVAGESPTYLWVPPSYLNNDTLLSPFASPPNDFTYTLFATTSFGCKADDTVQVKVVKNILVPNAFTPNGDGINDRWHIPSIDAIPDASVYVYNRFGNLVYHVKGEPVNWDGYYKGKPQPAGIYVYYIKFKSSYPDMKGTILLIR
jgi:gliding motility-associated-like protein